MSFFHFKSDIWEGNLKYIYVVHTYLHKYVQLFVYLHKLPEFPLLILQVKAHNKIIMLKSNKRKHSNKTKQKKLGLKIMNSNGKKVFFPKITLFPFPKKKFKIEKKKTIERKISF